MRLKIVVKRHGLPDSPIVWAVEGNQSISQVLEQINEVLPLESGSDWGLEDYAFELKGQSGSGFECLHFQQASQILKDGDEVVIRPLLTQDVRQRKLSGRHQLSTDGRHLIDGFPFGRPKLRAPYGRPDIDIPPRKRRKILLDEDDAEPSDDDALALMDEGDNDSEDVDYNEDDRQLIVRANFEDADASDENMENEEDEEYDPTEEDRADMAAELEELSEDEADGTQIRHAPKPGFKKPWENHPSEHSITSNTVLDIVHAAFPAAPEAVCKTVLSQAGHDMGQVWDILSRGFSPAKSRNSYLNLLTREASMVEESQSSELIRKAQGQKNASNVNGREDHDEENEVDDEDEDEDEEGEQEDPMLKYYDQNGLAAGSISSGKPLTSKPKIVFADDDEPANLQSQRGRHDRAASTGSLKNVRFNDEIATADVTGMDIDDEDDESDDGDFDGMSTSNSSIDSDSDDEPGEIAQTKLKVRSDPSSGSDNETSSSGSSSDSNSDSESHSDSDAESGSDSDSDSDSEPEEASSKVPIPSISQQDVSVAAATKTPAKPVKPGHGAKSTKARNQRRRNANALARFKAKGILPAGTTLSEFAELNMAEIDTLQQGQDALAALQSQTRSSKKADKAEQSAEAEAEFAARRQQLLDSLTSGGIDVAEETPPKKRSTKASVQYQKEKGATHTTTESNSTLHGSLKSNSQMAASSTDITAAASTPEAIADNATPESAAQATRKRSKLDMGAGRRLLFGALGIKTPRNKADEEKVKSDLMKFAKPLRTTVDDQPIAPEPEYEDPEAWREKITLRAVECCYQGVEYSEPPFPFVQRWDPQQQGSYGKRGGKGKRKQRDQSQFYESQIQNKRQKKKKDNINDNAAADDSYSNFSDDYVEPGNDRLQDTGSSQFPGSFSEIRDADEAIHEQLTGNNNDKSQNDTDNDLPALPTDMSTLPILRIEEVKPGAVITFKQLIMSEATQWQPQMSEYRTAIVIQVPVNSPFELQLAQRDREWKEKFYDEETGERIYGKFEVPDDDDEGEEGEDEVEDDGFLEANFTEFVDPKLVRAAPEAATTHASTNESNRVDHEKISSVKGCVDDVLPALTDNNAGGEGMEVAGQAGARGDELQADNLEVLPNEISDSDRQEFSQFFRDAGFRSSVPNSINDLHLKENQELLSQNVRAYSPVFNGFSSPLRPFVDIEPAVGETATDIDSSTSGIHFSGNLAQSSQNASQSQSHSHVTDHGRQPTSPDLGDDTINAFVDSNSYITADRNYRSRESAEVSQLARLEDQSAELPPLDEVLDIYSTARNSHDSLAPEHHQRRLPMQSDFDEQAVDSYDRAMDISDAQLDGTYIANNHDGLGAIKHEQTFPNIHKAKTASLRMGSPKPAFHIPAGSQVFILSSSDAEPESQPEPLPAKAKHQLSRKKTSYQPVSNSSTTNKAVTSKPAKRASKKTKEVSLDGSFEESGDISERTTSTAKSRKSDETHSMGQGSQGARRTSGRRRGNNTNEF